jgi:hypothetical protein
MPPSPTVIFREPFSPPIEIFQSLIERSARDQLGGEAMVDFLPRGVVYSVICSLEDDG